MAIETFEFIDDLVAANPTATDNVSEGDDHLRGLKTTLKNTLPNITGAITATEAELNILDGATLTTAELNYVDGVTSNIQTQLGNIDTDLVNDTTPQLGGDLDCNGAQIQWSKGADVVSATALPVLTDGNYFDVTGTTAVTSINTTGGAGTLIKLHFDAILTLTHHATDLILPGGANITTAAGDEAEFIEYAAGDYRCTSYSKADGTSVVAAAGGATSIDGLSDATVSTSEPTISTNPSATGHLWVNKTSGESYVCTDSTTNLNVWTNIGSGTGNIQNVGTATGGTIVTSGGYKYHTFTSSGTFTISTANITVDYLVVAGGGGGGGQTSTAWGAGGGGAGGYKSAASQSLTPASYSVTVGAGGSGASSGGNCGSNGGTSSFNSLASTGGGGGMAFTCTPSTGGSGGGASASSSGGSGTSGEGFDGGASYNLSGNCGDNCAGGGGGGAGEVGHGASGSTDVYGGDGKNDHSTWATATSTGDAGYYAGGGGGGQGTAGNPGNTGGAGGGANGNGNAATANTGGGGGGGTNGSGSGGSGGSGIVIVRYSA